MRWVVLVMAAACGSAGSGAGWDGGPDAGAADGGLAGEPDGGPDAGAPGGGSDAGTTDGGSGAGSDPDAGWIAAAFDGPVAVEVEPRVAFGGLRLAMEGPTLAAVEISRDTALVSRRRLVVSRGGAVAWVRSETLDERFTDVAVHPSQDITVAVERRSRPRDSFELLRLDATGAERARTVLPRPTLRPGDLPDGGSATFAMRGVLDGSMVQGWLPWSALRAAGEDVVVGLLSHAERPDGALSETEVVSAVMWLSWNQGAYAERWSRVVDRVHALLPVAWQYDEFLWMDAAARLVVDVTAEEVVVGRTVTRSRCRTLEALGERTDLACRRDSSQGSPHRSQPFGWTRYSLDGERLGTAVVAPAELEEFVVFDMAVRGGEVALAGTVVRVGPSGEPPYFVEPPDTTPMSPYDGFLAVADLGSGALTWSTELDLGRGDFLASVRWTSEGLLAGGAADWNRWWGGMSLSRGADPLLVLAPLDGGVVRIRTADVQPQDRHGYVRAVALHDGAVIGVGPGDAPMTHSGDVDPAPMALGRLTAVLRRR